jgi:hypothetical protein
MAKGKTASKNNAALREKAQEVIFDGKKVKPVKFIGNGRKYMAVQFDDNSGIMAMGPDGMPLAWGSISGSGNTEAETATA